LSLKLSPVFTSADECNKHHFSFDKKHKSYAFSRPIYGIIPDMQPENSQNTPPSVEQQPVTPSVGAENIPRLPPLETKLERGQERVEQVAEAGARASDAAAPASVVVPVTPTLPAPPVVDDPGISGVTSPMTAADEDLIEKEWVDKAKEIINQTKEDPYTRTARVNELQRDYLQKRYGKVVGASE
jgi:hypothetical protein